MPASDGPVYYVISDLHIGGDEQLDHVDFLEELLEFLETLETTEEDAELVINGDAFGLWEFTGLDGPEKLDSLLDSYPELFDQLRATGENVPITLLPGNHDHELAAYDEYVERLAEYNVDLLQTTSFTRPIGDRTIWFEHGHQQDPNNRIEEFGSPYATPLGYFYNTHITSRAGQLSDRGRFNWLKDVQAVTPTQRMPIWLASKYFYREMNPAIRYSVIPFLFLFNISAVLAILAGLDLAGIWSYPVDGTVGFLGQFGLAGTAAYMIIAVNIVIAGLLLVVAVPLYILLRDVRITLDRFGIFEMDLTVDPETPYLDAAKDVFDEHPETVIFCYGHTHRPKVRRQDGRLLVNTGTWLKRLHRRDVIAGILPPVFYPSYQLCAVRIAPHPDGVEVDYQQIEKPAPKAEDLTRTERLLTLGRAPEPEVPPRTVIETPERTPRESPEITVDGGRDA